MARETIVLTHEKYVALTQELEQLKTFGRDDIAEKIKEARSFGDLSENAEYNEAMNEQAKLEARINKLEDDLSNATVLNENELGTEVIKPGHTVRLKDISYDEIVEYKILGKNQANPDEGIISDQSPIGKTLLGHKVGETVDVEIPNGVVLKFEVLAIIK